MYLLFSCRGLTVWEVPPPTAGLAALMALNLLEADQSLHLTNSLTSKQLVPEQEHPEPHDPSSSARALASATADGLKSHEWLHSAIESCRMAFADGLGYAGDPRLVTVPLEGLLDKERARERRDTYFNPLKVWPAKLLGGMACQHDKLL
jgi:gamma-glutamyltranspeptidase